MEESSQYYSSAFVPQRHKSFRPEKHNSHKDWMDHYNKCKTIVEESGLIFLCGNRGTGKTQLACCLIGHTCYNIGKTSLYTKAFGVFLDIRNCMQEPGESELTAVREYIRPYFLVIDAYEVRSDSPFENRTLDHIIDKRYDDMKSTLIITNDKLIDFIKNVGPSISDRCNETGGICEFVWDSFRERE